jgi:hypothetical protein
MCDGMVRILFSSLTTSISASSMSYFPPIIASISCLSFLVRVRKMKGARPRIRLAKAS